MSDERSQQQQKGYKAGGKAENENIHPETNESTVEKGNFRKNQDNIEKVVDSLTSEESINVFLTRQRLRFVKGNLNKQEMKDSMFLELNIAAHNIDGIASVL
ncbi:22676_t:CDS:1, partial [Rhizophagus irregularis]